MNIIFTDIDGVLNPKFKRQWDNKCVNLYNKICNDFNLKPVITSTWKNAYSIEELRQIFIEQGITVDIYDYTPTLEQSEREDEIKMWLKNNKIDKYVIVDDKDIELDNFVKCIGWNGLTKEEYDKIKKLLK